MDAGDGTSNSCVSDTKLPRPEWAGYSAGARRPARTSGRGLIWAQALNTFLSSMRTPPWAVWKNHPRVRGPQSVSSGRSRSAWPRPSAFASSGERTRAPSDTPSQFSHRIAISTPLPGCTCTSSSGTGSEEPQSGQVRSFYRASRVAFRFCSSESDIPAEQLLWLEATEKLDASRREMSTKG
jgi:hypothetical protein